MSDETVETGLAGLTAAVTMEQPPVPPPALLAPSPAYKKEPLPDGWNLNRVAGLVRDVAQSMYDLPTILKKHGLTDKQYNVLAGNEFFTRALEQFTLDWNSAANTQKRLSLEAAIALEDAMPVVAARAHKPTEALSDVVALVKVLAEIAGTIGTKAANQPVAPTERFKIIFNLNGDLVERSASVQIIASTEASGDTLQPLLEAAGVPSPLQSLGQRPRN